MELVPDLIVKDCKLSFETLPNLLASRLTEKNKFKVTKII